MALSATLQQYQLSNSNDEITFYHVCRSASYKDSFINEGAQPIGHGLNGQNNGFYVFANEEKVNTHIHFLNDERQYPDPLIVSCHIPISAIKYPQWQYDYELVGESLLPKIKEWGGDFITQNGQNLDIKIPNHAIYKDASIQKFFTTPYGIKAQLKDGKRKIIIGLTSGDHSIPQLLVDWLCKECPNFKEKYNSQMQSSAKRGKAAFKYCGEKPLPVHTIWQAHLNEDNSIDKKIVYTKQSMPVHILSERKNQRN